MSTLREWREHAEARDYQRLAELCDYLQADESNHVKLATRWIPQLIGGQPERLNELVEWSRQAVAHIEGFYGSAYGGDNGDGERPEPRFTFLRGRGDEFRTDESDHSHIIGE